MTLRPIGARTPYSGTLSSTDSCLAASREPQEISVRCSAARSRRGGRPHSHSARQNNMGVPARLEIALSITAYIAGIVGVGLGARLILEAVGPHPAVAQAIY